MNHPQTTGYQAIDRSYGPHDMAEAMPASPVQSAMRELHDQQSRTNDLLGSLTNRLADVLDHANKVGGAAGPKAVAPSISPLHGELTTAADRQDALNGRIAELLNRITL